MRIYTRGGDLGETGLYGGTRVRKDDLRVEAYGTMDELNAVLGIAANSTNDESLKKSIIAVQQQLFAVAWDLSTPLDGSADRVSEAQTKRLEKEIDEFEEELEPLRNFILPGGGADATAIHLARCVCRRAERRVVTLMRETEINPEVERYLNRLSDYLFVLARVATKRAGGQEVTWTRS